MLPPARFSGLIAGTFVLCSLLGFLQASPPEEGTEEEVEEAADLPSWEEGYFRGSFDTRLWPSRTIRWLEQENLRDLIADPDLADSERMKLKQLLGFSRGWRMHANAGTEGITEVN